MSSIRTAAVETQVLLTAAKFVKEVMSRENSLIHDKLLCAIDVNRPVPSKVMSYFLKDSDTITVTITDTGSEWKATLHHINGSYNIHTVVSAKSPRVGLYGSGDGSRIAKMSRSLLDNGVIITNSDSLAAHSVLLAYKMSVHPATYRTEVEAYVDTYHDTLEGAETLRDIIFPIPYKR